MKIFHFGRLFKFSKPVNLLRKNHFSNVMTLMNDAQICKLNMNVVTPLFVGM